MNSKFKTGDIIVRVNEPETKLIHAIPKGTICIVIDGTRGSVRMLSKHHIGYNYPTIEDFEKVPTHILKLYRLCFSNS